MNWREPLLPASRASATTLAPGGDVYTLHQSPIAVHEKDSVVFFWHGYYTPTTASHMNAILKALGASFRVSYAQARDTGATTFVWGE